MLNVNNHLNWDEEWDPFEGQPVHWTPPRPRK